MKERVPLTAPSMRAKRSPVSRKCFTVAMIGSPAPTDACRHEWARQSAAIVLEHTLGVCKCTENDCWQRRAVPQVLASVPL